LYSSPSIIRVNKSRWMSWVDHAACMGKIRNANNVLVGKPEGRKTLWRRRWRWEDDMKINLKETGVRVWIRLNFAQDRDQW